MSPNDVAMLLCVLIRWVDFVVVFRYDFSTFLKSFIVVVVREGVMVCNPKTDSNSEFGGPKTVEERVGCAWGKNGQNAIAWCPRVSHVSHTWTDSLCPHVAHATCGQREAVHVWLTWLSRGQQWLAIWPILPFRAPDAFFDRFRPSELRFQIRIRITNRDSHMHDKN